MTYVALYLRISPKPNGKGWESCNDQAKWGRAYAAKNWPSLPVREYRDELISGAEEDREAFKKLRHDLDVDPPAFLWTVEQYRLARDERLWFAFAAELVAAGLEDFHTDRDGIVRVEDEVAGIKAVIAAGMRRRMLRSQADTLAAIAARGLPPGSRPFGYRHAINDRGERTYAIVDEQAKAIRDAADKVLAGWSLAHIAVELAERGLHGGHRVKLRNADGLVLLDDGRWVDPRHPEVETRAVTRPSKLTTQSVRGMLTAPTIAGRRVHKGKVVAMGNWPAILDDDTFEAVRAKLDKPRIVRRADGGEYPITRAHVGNPAGRKYLLTGGLAECGVCEMPMIGSNKKMKKGRIRERRYLLCHPNRGGGGCVGIMLDETEMYVRDELFRKLSDPKFLAGVANDSHAQVRDGIAAKLEAIKGKRGKLAEAWAAGEVTDVEWKSARHKLTSQERELRIQLEELPPPMLRMDVMMIEKLWRSDQLELDEKREILRTFIEKVTILPATPGRQGFDSGRVEIQYYCR